AGGARQHLDKELLAKLFRQELSDQTCNHVGCAARRLANDDFYRARRIGLRAYGSGKHRRTRCQMQELSAGKFHTVSPAPDAIDHELPLEPIGMLFWAGSAHLDRVRKLGNVLQRAPVTACHRALEIRKQLGRYRRYLYGRISKRIIWPTRPSSTAEVTQQSAPIPHLRRIGCRKQRCEMK